MKAVPDYVLVVDDDALFRAYVRGVLEESGYRVVDAEDGFSALAAMRASTAGGCRPRREHAAAVRLRGAAALREEHGADCR